MQQQSEQTAPSPSWPDGKPRFIVREITGYAINPGRHSGGGNRPPTTDVMILDRAYCHRVVAYFKAAGNGQPHLAARQHLAEYHCAKLNADDAEADAA